ncbi:DNA mismatch repair protein MutS [Desulfonispora thiosulfatigenes DSM 11270]|uniref:DNA mismatch repair protein MutS n=1 Tax=Desulfonispora thiosulfatigenes DSM 11270 TaxID=656914 RepID=A0A1W1VNX3_DESTI|nr:DNA mismatch repair protein MutS [Desulfonispora thiosulfatigenes]SMB95075.1 DNA mismatch repair protein MutS [Desulfonispora thiosulfatigenes DSM 11270]
MFSSTPMLIQYQEIKNSYKDCILFYRLGDFYEMFGSDAEVASKVLEIALTSREAGKGRRIPMCGVPFHSADNYIAKLINNDYKVAICEQMEDPKKSKGIVKRDVVRIITPGTVLENNLLHEENNNFLVCITKGENSFGLAAVDISTGEFYTSEINKKEDLINEVLRYTPAECITSKTQFELDQLPNSVKISYHYDYAFKGDYCKKILLEHFNLNTLQSIGLENFPEAIKASGAVLDYLISTQKNPPGNIEKLKIYHIEDNMYLDFATKKNLELIQPINIQEKNSTLLSVLDKTVTPLGARMLKSWLTKPLVNKEEIQNRLNANEELVNNLDLRMKLRKLLDSIYDLERIIAKISFGNANAKDLLALKNSLEILPKVKTILEQAKSYLLKQTYEQFDDLNDIYSLLEKALYPDPPFSVREGNLINDNYNEEIDYLRSITRDGKEWILKLEQEEKQISGIKSLKIGYNKIFGYYIEITKSYLHLVPEHYIRKQTLANAERFITPELKEKEALVLGADDKLKELEYQTFIMLREEIKAFNFRILAMAKIIAELDCLASLAQVAVTENYIKPEISNNTNFNISNCRHPVVEKKLAEQWFIPNDINMNSDNHRFLIITGPNMGGKSTYCRSVALASILMQIGSFIPADKAELPIVDRVFARVGANDNLSTGQSTFMVEMSEVANIINNATKDSLIILDEVGRGTSTYDGLSIAWSLTEYIHNIIKAKTLFATHYHELITLEEKLNGVKNYSVSVKEEGDDIVFIRKIISGGADRSYGIQVAKLAGLPSTIIERSKDILSTLEQKPEQTQLSFKETEYKEEMLKIKEIQELKSKHELNTKQGINTKQDINSKHENVLKQLEKIDLLNITPLEAINTLYKLQNSLKSED